VLDGCVVARRSNAQHADVIYGHAHVDRDPKAANARVDRQARTSSRFQELDLSVESPATELSARAAVDGDVSATLRQDRRESFGDGCHSTAECIEVRDPWLAFSALVRRKNDRALTLQAETPRSIVRSHTDADRALRTPQRHPRVFPNPNEHRNRRILCDALHTLNGNSARRYGLSALRINTEQRAKRLEVFE